MKKLHQDFDLEYMSCMQKILFLKKVGGPWPPAHDSKGLSSGSRPTNATYGSRSTFLKTSNVNQLSQLKAENVHIC